MLNLNLDIKNDILYIRFVDTSNSYGEEIENGLVVLRDMANDNITGITIFDFVKKYQENEVERLELPIDINFERDVIPNIASIIN